MGNILNPRGAGGSGKTELVRRILYRYGWKAGERYGGSLVECLYVSGRSRPFAYRLPHPFGGRPLVVIGHYEVTSGGCDTIRQADGGLVEVARSADAFTATGHDVIIEGLRLSSDVEHSMALARSRRLLVLRLRTPLRRCVYNLASRRRVGPRAHPAIERAVKAEHARIEQACQWLRPHAYVEDVTFDEALARAGALLGLTS
ncbi:MULTISPECIES: hypothetical protein [Chelativorans]|uniref:Uncharacterized protein n=1 Tax=Chelativorans sp. (strain BNC1) TaxID=266779 RepID=Q11F88_CHESB|nr:MULTISPECIES: hypothetical protein [Chelativorans]